MQGDVAAPDTAGDRATAVRHRSGYSGVSVQEPDVAAGLLGLLRSSLIGAPTLGPTTREPAIPMSPNDTKIARPDESFITLRPLLPFSSHTRSIGQQPEIVSRVCGANREIRSRCLRLGLFGGWPRRRWLGSTPGSRYVQIQ
jgi:hypothetical protein